jgi:hypothetical protein
MKGTIGMENNTCVKCNEKIRDNYNPLPTDKPSARIICEDGWKEKKQMDKQTYYEYLLTLPREELEQMLKDVIHANENVNQFEGMNKNLFLISREDAYLQMLSLVRGEKSW